MKGTEGRGPERQGPTFVLITVGPDPGEEQDYDLQEAGERPNLREPVLCARPWTGLWQQRLSDLHGPVSDAATSRESSPAPQKH